MESALRQVYIQNPRHVIGLKGSVLVDQIWKFRTIGNTSERPISLRTLLRKKMNTARDTALLHNETLKSCLDCRYYATKCDVSNLQMQIIFLSFIISQSRILTYINFDYDVQYNEVEINCRVFHEQDYCLRVNIEIVLLVPRNTLMEFDVWSWSIHSF